MCLFLILSVLETPNENLSIFTPPPILSVLEEILFISDENTDNLIIYYNSF